jgi:hypothetical protein
MDLLLYERIPEMIPLRATVLDVYSRLQRLYEDGPVDAGVVRRWYAELAEQFFRLVGILVKAGHTEKLRAMKHLLRERHRLYVETLVLACPGVGRVEL